MSDVKEKIIEGATRCFARFGYAKTTLDDIGKSVGLKKNSLYHYFKNKEDLFFVILNREINKYTNESELALSSVKGIKNKIITYFETKLAGCGTQSILTAILAEIWDPAHPLYERVYDLFFEKEVGYLISFFDQAREDGEIIDYDYKKYAESLSLVFSLFKQYELNRTSVYTGENMELKLDTKIIFIIETMLKAIIK